MGIYDALGPNWSFDKGCEVSPEEANREHRERVRRTGGTQGLVERARRIFNGASGRAGGNSSGSSMSKTSSKRERREALRRGEQRRQDIKSYQLGLANPYTFAGRIVAGNDGTPMTIGTALRILLAEARPPASDHAAAAAEWYERITDIEAAGKNAILDVTAESIQHLRALIATVPRDHPAASTTILGGMLLELDRLLAGASRLIPPAPPAAHTPQPPAPPAPAPEPKAESAPAVPEPAPDTAKEGGDKPE